MHGLNVTFEKLLFYSYGCWCRHPGTAEEDEDDDEEEEEYEEIKPRE